MQIKKNILSKIQNTNFGPILIIISATLWALDGLIRQHLYSLPPITIIFFEHLFGLIILFPFVYKYISKERLKLNELGIVILIAVLSGLLGTLWFTTALVKVNFISLSVVFLIQKLQPIFAITTASIFLKEKLDKKYIKWALLAIVSAYFVTFPNGIVDLHQGKGTVIAALYALGAAFAWGSSTTFSKILLNKVRFEVSTFYRFLFTTIIAFPVLLYFNSSASLFTPTINQYLLFVLIAVSTGMVALLIYYKGLSKTSVHVSTILELTFPFIAIILDITINHKVLSISQLLAALVLVFSIYQITQLRQNNSYENNIS